MLIIAPEVKPVLGIIVERLAAETDCPNTGLGIGYQLVGERGFICLKIRNRVH